MERGDCLRAGWKQMKMNSKIKKLAEKKEDGLGVIEIILIIVVLIGLVIIFRTKITELIGNIVDLISDRVKGI